MAEVSQRKTTQSMKTTTSLMGKGKFIIASGLQSMLMMILARTLMLAVVVVDGGAVVAGSYGLGPSKAW